MTEPSSSNAPNGLRGARRQLAVLYEEVRRRRDDALRASGEPNSAGWVVALVPAHSATLQHTAPARHAAFAARLRELVTFVRAHGPEKDPRTLAEPPALSDFANAIVGATCSACGGACCGNGGEHAFLRSGTVRAFMARHPALDDEGVVSAYLAHLPREAMHPGCVFQGVTGCTLPRDMRSVICNAYLCGGLQHALEETITAEREAERDAERDPSVAGATRGVFVAQRTGGAIAGGVLQPIVVPPVSS